jgi:APA family basic amino acid/polyamine antiporter
VPRRRRQSQSLERVLGAPALFATAYGNVGSSIYYALGLTAGIALGLTPVVFIISGLIFAATAATYAEGTVRYPEAGGSASFARHAFDELVSFGAAWAQMLNYVITVAISVIFVPHYLSIFWEPLRTNPWDIVVGIAFTWLLVAINVVGIQEAARLNIALAVIDFATQLLLVALGFFLIFHPHVLWSNVHWGVAPSWSAFLLAIPVAMIAYTGIETVSNLAEEARDPVRSIPRAISWVAIAVFAIYFTLPWIALSAMPVVKQGGHFVTQLGQPPPNGFKNDPVLGLVENLGLHGVTLSVAKIYVGVLAATILFIATNAGVIGASRITYSMASYRQLPSVFRRLHSKLKTPWLALIVFAGIGPTTFLLSGQVDFLGRMYAFGAMLSFTIAHVAVIALRIRRPDEELGAARPRARARVPVDPRADRRRPRVARGRGGGRAARHRTCGAHRPAARDRRAPRAAARCRPHRAGRGGLQIARRRPRDRRALRRPRNRAHRPGAPGRTRDRRGGRPSRHGDHRPRCASRRLQDDLREYGGVRAEERPVSRDGRDRSEGCMSGGIGRT